MTMSMRWIAVGLLVVAGAFRTTSESPEWSQFRGSDGQGTAQAERLPRSWGEGRNVAWKTPIHGKGWSSPILGNQDIWLTTATEDGKELSGICVDRETGKIVYDRLLFSVENPQFAHKFNSYASPTPVLDEERVYLTFGSPGTVCLDRATKAEIWKRTDIECNHFRGSGSSPILHGDLLIMNFDGSDYQFVIALDKYTGRTVWRTKRSIDFQDLDRNGKPMMDGDFRKAFSTPQIARFDRGPVLVSLGSKCLYGYDPLSGRELWRVESRISHSGSTRPTVGRDRIYYATGFPKGQLWCVNPGGAGDVTATHVLWQMKRSVSNKPSMILTDSLLFMIHDGGVASCMDAGTGEVYWQERIGGNYSASPLLHGQAIYFFSEEGKTTVIAAAKQFRVLETNELDDGFMASAAVAGNSLILRTRSHLYRVD